MVELRTKGFDKLATRFYQVQLTGAGVIYNQNGVYLAENKTLSITLPAGIKPAAYMVSILFLSTSGQQLYEQQSDQQLTIIE
ncbi:hypothetical protein [Dyadobacter sp. NIV53]|uniref:hypothetical protein n=1 Tax=Dyadobacter sp. NIV53 TaxID=2861765 RepID=UPI001C87CA65|nr:hypothetical protein [Dyadobacter sp. NIV53]